MTLSDTTYSGPYARAAQTYRSAGWHGTLPLGNAPGKKSPVPGGWTGHGAPYPSSADVAAWQETHGDRNIGLRMPPGVIGLDVDAYTKDGKRKAGDETLAGLIAQYGPLPATWVSSARPAPSGIRFYRVPSEIDGREINWPGEAGPFIEIVQPGHRYAVVWPSTNPDADGAPYEWRHESGLGPVAGERPRPDELPWLPEAWVRGLALAYDRAEKGSLGSEALVSWWRKLRHGTPWCPVVHSVWTKAGDELRAVESARHETARDAVAALVRLGGEGHKGAPDAVTALGAEFAQAVGEARMASGEWSRLLNGGVQIAAAAEPAPLQHCEHDAAVTLPDAAAFYALVVEQQQAEHRAEVDRRLTRVQEMAEDPKLDAEAVRLLIPEIAQWGEAEVSHARDELTKKSGKTDLGLTQFDRLIKDERRAQKEAAEVAEQEAARVRHAEQVTDATLKGVLLPSPHAPIDVARALAGKMTIPAKWWRGDYYLWDGTRYREWAPEAVDHWLYGQTADAKYDPGEDKELAPWRPSETKIGAVSHALSRGVLYRESAIEPDDRPAQIVCTNGVYSVAADTISPHHPERFNLQALPFAYDRDAKCPTWEWFLSDVLPADAVRLLKQFIGYLVSGRTDLEKILHLKGLPRSGKGTAAHVIENLLGAENVASPSMPSLVGTFGEQPLIGKSLAIFSDVNWQFREIAEAVEVVKKISGRDSRDVNRKNRDVWHGRLDVRFVFMGNDLPSFKDSSGAFAYRMLHIHFPGTVQGREDPTLKTRLLDELPGILNWAIDGLRDLEASGNRFCEPDSARELAAEVRRQQGPVQPFIEDMCARAEGAPPVPLDELHPVYRAWARKADVEHVLDRERFSRALSSAGLIVKREMINGVRARRVYGIVPLAEEGVSVWVRILNPLGALPPPPR